MKRKMLFSGYTRRRMLAPIALITGYALLSLASPSLSVDAVSAQAETPSTTLPPAKALAASVVMADSPAAGVAADQDLAAHRN